MHPADPLEVSPGFTRLAGLSVPVDLLRLDRIESWASGNKFFKLQYYLAEAIDRGVGHLCSKGGMFSNHLEALARACSIFGLRLTCVIRSHGDDPANPSLRRLRDLGASLVFLSPQVYPGFDACAAAALDPDAMFIPEGGDGPLGWLGTAGIVTYIQPTAPTHVVLPCGTFGTATGILRAAPPEWTVILVPAWKGCEAGYVARKLEAAGVEPACRWEVWPEYHAGGFGQYDEALRSFIFGFTQRTGVVLDPVYTGKMMFALEDSLSQGRLPPDSRVVAVHTGGLQGLDGYRYRFPSDWGAYPMAGQEEE